MALYTVSVPENLYHRLQQQAKSGHRSIDELVRQALSRQIPPTVSIEDDLPAALRTELQAMESLSAAALWSLARSTLSSQQLAEIDQLQTIAQERLLSVSEKHRQRSLLHEYDETILRRAHAAMLLSSRGYDLSDPNILQQP